MKSALNKLRNQLAGKPAVKETPVFTKPKSLLAHHVAEGPAAVAYAEDEAARDELRRVRRQQKNKERVRLGGYYKIKGSDARKLAAGGQARKHGMINGLVPDDEVLHKVYIPQAAPLRPEPKRKHRSVKAYRRRSEKRAAAMKAALRNASKPMNFSTR